MSFTSVASLSLSFLISVLACYSILILLVGKLRLDINGLLVVGLSCGIGPLMISYLFGILLFALPSQSPLFYLATVMGVLFVPILAILYKSGWRSLTSSWEWQMPSLRLGRKVDVIVVLALSFTLLLGWIAVALLPLYSNDPLEYFKTASVLSERLDLYYYPISNPVWSNGFFAPWTHPPGYVGLLVWSKLFSHDSLQLGVERFIAWYFAFSTALLLIGWSKRLGILAALLLITVPIYFAGVSSSHIDTTRIFPILAVFVIFQSFIKQQSSSLLSSWRFVLLSGVLIGFCIFVHSIGIVALPIWCAAYFFLFLLGRIKFAMLVRNGISVVALSVLFVAIFLVSNFQTMGRVISDTPKVWALESIGHTSFVAAQRNIDTPKKKVLNGVFKGLKNLRSYAIFYWLFVLSLIVFLAKLRLDFRSGKTWGVLFDKYSLEMTCLGVVLVYFSMTLITVFLGSDAFIKNDRYPLSIHPFIAVMNAFGVVHFYQWLFND